jgi:hypothetical protein
MVNLPVLAQCFGLIGDLLNLIGAGILVRDLTRRSTERREQDAAEELASFARKRGINMSLEGLDLRNPKAVDVLAEMVDKRTERLGRFGFRFIFAGFAFLALYRIAELLDSLPKA